MRRFSTLVLLLCLAIPAGISISGCTRNPGANYCNGLGYGLKITDVYTIDLEPRTTGISLAFGQTQQVQAPSAKTCQGNAASVSTYTYGTSNNQLVDISPSGNICAGTWNRNSGGGIADYTICQFPNPLPSSNALPYSSAFITAAANAVTSNPVQVFVHAQVTSLSLVGPTTCLSQGQQYPNPLDVQACYSATVNGAPANALLCAPSTVSSAQYACPAISGGPIPACSSAIGTLTYSVGTSAIASIDPETNLITAEQPGTTLITASVAESGSSAGYFSTCPPAKISVSLNGISGTSTPVTVTQGVTQNLVTSVTDTLGNPITGLTLDYQSTNPIDISAGGTGAITASFPGQASIYAVCQPPTCNPSPINETGLNGTGLSIASNPVAITTPGTASAYFWVAAPGQSQYFTQVELLTGTVGSPVRMPYVPNSMLMDRTGTNLYFGSSKELMIYATATNSLSKADTTVPGVVLAVSPNNQQLLINDQARQLFYIYNTSGTIAAQFGGMGNAAAWSPDSKTLYITDNASLNDPVVSGGPSPLITGHTDTLYVYNVNTGWTTYALPPSTLPAGALPPDTAPANAAVWNTQQTPALTIPGVGAYLRGDTSTGIGTVAHTWCPQGNVDSYASTVFYPVGDTVPVQSDALAATPDGQHILGAAFSSGSITLNDIGVTIPSTECPLAGLTMSALPIVHTTPQPYQFSNVTSATAVNQVVVSPVSNLAFITYTGGVTTGGPSVPYYVPGSNGVGYVPLAGTTATAPLAGAFSPDDTLFFVSTAGDNQIHYISISPSAPLKDTQQIAPNLPVCVLGSDVGCFPATPNNPVVPATVIVVKPRSTT